MYFVIIAHDGTDPGALDRRMAVRQQHLANILKVKEKGSVISAGGITNEAKQLIGSFLVMEFASRELLDEYLATEPYITAGVWQDIRIEPCNLVIKDDVLVGK